jgi:hypothetical protein
MSMPGANKQIKKTGARAAKVASHQRARPKVKSAPSSATGTKTSPPLSLNTTAPTVESWQPAADEVGIRVRMYRVGFGDFFLLSLLRDGAAPAHIIIDCGVFKGTSQGGDIGSIEAAVAHMARVTGGQISLIVMTHRHADHIAGFARCSDVFKQLRVEAVWMPVWESEYSDTATKFQAQLLDSAEQLQTHFAQLGAAASEEQQTARKFMENALGAAGSGSNAAALDLLKRGLKVTPKYYQEGSKPDLPGSLLEAGLAAKILGPPPIQDLDLMKLMDLQKGVGQYLSAVQESDASACAPFGNEWELPSPDAYKALSSKSHGAMAFSEWMPRTGAPQHPVRPERDAQTRMEQALLNSQPVMALTAAKQLNSFLNNQSLVILFSFKGKNLLFAGDAQAGNWEHWLFQIDQPDKKAAGQMTDAAREILSSIDLYKMGHHGSGNATPRTVVRTMGTDAHKFVSLCSTQAGVYGTEDPEDPTKGTEVPRIPLLEDLGNKSALVRSDQIPIKVGTETIAPAVERPMPPNGKGYRLAPEELWVDCFL